MNDKGFIIILFMLIFMILGWLIYIDGTEIPPEIVINTTEVSCDNTQLLNFIEGKFTYTNKQISKLNDSIEELNYANIQFYPRTQRTCKRPIPFDYYGSSMQPFLYEGDSFYVEKVAFKDIELGDVVVFEVNGVNRVHSVIALYENFIQTAGYNMPEPDPYVSKEQILYRYCER